MGKTLPILLATAVLAGVSFSNPALANNDVCAKAAEAALSRNIPTHGIKSMPPNQTGRLVKQAMNDAGCKNATVEVFLPKGGSSNAANRVRWHCEVSGPPFHANCSFGNI